VATVTDDELRQYFLAWQESTAEVGRLESLEPSPLVEQALARARADEEHDRVVYFRLRKAWLAEHGK
jgi:hypothetical protein